MENDSYAVQGQHHKDLINLTIPVKLDGSYDECKIIVNGTLETCSEWVYDYSVFTRTVNSQVKTIQYQKSIDSIQTWVYVVGIVRVLIFHTFRSNSLNVNNEHKML